MASLDKCVYLSWPLHPHDFNHCKSVATVRILSISSIDLQYWTVGLIN
jgi:hypothetical protein